MMAAGLGANVIIPGKARAGRKTLKIFMFDWSKTLPTFKEWFQEKYVKELLKSVESEDALSKYYVRDLVDKVNKQPGQFFVDPYLYWFSKALKKYSSDDHRTMYVGITEVNIYSGDNNYIFSLGIASGPSRASILSYHINV